MNIYKLQYFLKLAENGNMTRTAESENISQQALSAMIGSLERELGISLFNRKRGSFTLTPEGTVIRDGALKMVGDYEEMLRRLGELQADLDRELSLSSVAMHAARLLLSDFLKLCPDIRTVFSTCSFEQIPDRLWKENVNFVISSREPDRTDIASTLIIQEPLYIVAARSHRLAGRESVSLMDVRDERFAMPLKNHPFRLEMEKICQQAGFRMNVRSSSDSDGQIANCVVNSGDITFVGRSSSHNSYYSQENAVMIPLTDEIARRSLYLLYRRDVRLGGIRKQFFDFALENAQGIIMRN